jgi:hypothetical protein
MGIFKTSGAASQARSSTGNSIRGKISGPISVSNSLDDSFPFRGPGVGVASSPVDNYGRMPELPMGPPPAPPQSFIPMAHGPATGFAPASGPAHILAQAPYPAAHPVTHAMTHPVTYTAPASVPVSRMNHHEDNVEMPAAASNRASSHGSSLQRTVAGSAETAPNPDPVRFSGVSLASHHSFQGHGNGYGGPQRSRDGPQRKKSTLRNTLDRLFGRKRKDGSRGSNDLDTPIAPIEEEEGPSSPFAARHTVGGTIENGHMDEDVDMEDGGDEPKRSNSLPITEFDRALRSHSIGPDDVSMIESARNSLLTEFSFSRRRAATTGSRAPSYPQRRDTDELMGLTPRPAGAPNRGARSASAMANLDIPGRANDPSTNDDYSQGAFADDQEHDAAHGHVNADALAHAHEGPDPGEIGKAITSDGRQFTLQHKRRSRSLSGLQNLDLERAGMRRRSDEIRYWRESYDPARLSPMPPHPTGTGNGDEPVVVSPYPIQAVSANGNLSQPFDFGTVPLSPISDGNGAKITDAVGLTHRLTGIEARVRRIEKMMSSPLPLLPSPSRPLMHSSGPHFNKSSSNFGSNPSSSVDTNQDSNPSSPRSIGHSVSGRMSFGDGPAMAGRLHPPPPPPVAAAAINIVRPTSNSTLRGVSSLPSLTQQASLQIQAQAQTIDQAPGTAASGALTLEHYNTLLALINSERTERQELMSQVRKLERRVALFTGGSVPVGHVAHRESSFLLEPPPTAKSFGERSFFDEDEEDEEDEEADDGDQEQHGAAQAELKVDGQRRDRRHRCEPHPEDSGVVTHVVGDDDDNDDEDDDDVSYSDEFFTPREEYLSPPHGVGAFGEPLRETPGGKKAARTLSLSQLTLPPTAY